MTNDASPSSGDDEVFTHRHADATAPDVRPAFYAAHRGGWGDWWTLLHPPYTAWNLAYVVIGACLAPHVAISRLIATMLAFFFAVGLAAHALDELHGRPLATRIPAPVLVATTVVSLAGALALGLAGLSRVGGALIPFMIVGPVLVVTYNLELFGGVMHNGVGLGLSWGSFTVLVGYVAQTGRLSLSAVLAAGGAFALIMAQRALSARARLVRRRVVAIEGAVTLTSGERVAIDERWLLAPLESALKATAWGVILLATAMAAARLG